MNELELVYLKNDEAVCSSLDVAVRFGKEHSKVIRSIEQMRENSSSQNWLKCFKLSTYQDVSGKSNKMYFMNRDGFSLLVMGFNGKKAMDWKWKYIEAFNTMEKLLRERSTEVWLETRKQGKLTRRLETDVIKNLVEYAKEQGSTHSDKLYMTYTNLANKMSGVSDRDKATITQLNNLSLMENIILNCIQSGIALDKHYKEIYKDCKRRLEAFKDIAYLEFNQIGSLD